MRVPPIVDHSFSVNLHLVEAERPVLVDAGTGRDHPRIARTVREILKDRRLEAILLTHRHFDHVGGAPPAAPRPPPAPPRASRKVRGPPPLAPLPPPPPLLAAGGGARAVAPGSRGDAVGDAA